MKRYNPNKYMQEDNKDLNELIGKLKAQYGTKLKDTQDDKEYKKLSKQDKEYVTDELKSEGFY